MLFGKSIITFDQLENVVAEIKFFFTGNPTLIPTYSDSHHSKESLATVASLVDSAGIHGALWNSQVDKLLAALSEGLLSSKPLCELKHTFAKPRSS